MGATNFFGMPIYYLQSLDGHVKDDPARSIELANEREARIEAVVFSGEAIRNEPELLVEGSSFRVEVRDARKWLLFTVVTRALELPSAPEKP